MSARTTWTAEKKKEACDKIFERMYAGESVRKILDNADRNEFPSFVTFAEWLKDDDGLAKQYAYVCEMRADAVFEEILAIADNKENDVVEIDGIAQVNHNVINRDRLRVDARKWMLGKMQPKKYGDRIDVTTGGEKINIPVIKWVDSSE